MSSKTQLPPPTPSSPLAVRQDPSLYKQEDHFVWQFLFSTQIKQVAPYATQWWKKGIEALQLTHFSIPHLSKISEKLFSLTGWQVTPVSDELTPTDFFHYLCQKQYPCITWIRLREQSGTFLQTDLFSDVFGMLPNLCNTDFATWLHSLAIQQEKTTNTETRKTLHSLFWMISQYGTIKSGSEKKVFGAKILSQNNFCHRLFSKDNPITTEPFLQEKIASLPEKIPSCPQTIYTLTSLQELVLNFCIE